MMQEVDSEDQVVSGQMSDQMTAPTIPLMPTNIADQLHDAAQTNVMPQAPPGSVAAIPLTPANTEMSGSLSAVPPPMTGFVRGGIMQTAPGTGMQAYVAPPEMTGCPAVAVGSRESSPGAASYVIPHSSQGMVAPAPLPSPHDVSCEVPYEEGPVYPTHSGKSGLLGWFSGGVNRVMEKTKSSMETMITTLDPGMKQVIHSGGDLDVVVTSTKDVKVQPLRRAFQEAFGRATVTGRESQPNIAPQPIGFAAALQGADQRITQLRQSGAIDAHQVAVSVENFVVELLPDKYADIGLIIIKKWFDIGCLVLRDTSTNISLETYTQATPITPFDVSRAQDQTPPDYPLRWSGLAVTIGEVINQVQPEVNPSDWHLFRAGVSRRELIYTAARSLAYVYKQRLQNRVH